MDILGLISTFIRVVENGSIAAAARAKGMSPAAISQSLSRLEAHLGVRLLSRTTRSMTLTENGKRYFEKVRHIPQDIELASQAAANETKPQGPLCIATTAAFGRYVLAPLMPAFKASFPDIDIELISTDRNVDHRLEGVDVSIRIEAQLNDQLIARKIASLPFIFCAAPLTLIALVRLRRLENLASTPAWFSAIPPTDGFCHGRLWSTDSLLMQNSTPVLSAMILISSPE